MRNPFRYFNSSPEIIRLTEMMYIRYPLSLRQVGDLLFERGIDICQETVRFWWNRFGPMLSAFGAAPTKSVTFDAFEDGIHQATSYGEYDKPREYRCRVEQSRRLRDQKTDAAVGGHKLAHHRADQRVGDRHF